jgi:hypothetical protein
VHVLTGHGLFTKSVVSQKIVNRFVSSCQCPEAEGD